MDIHDFATLLVLAAQNPRGLVLSYTSSRSTEHLDHAACLVKHIETQDSPGDLVAFFGPKRNWTFETREPPTHDTACDICDTRGFTEWTS